MIDLKFVGFGFIIDSGNFLVIFVFEIIDFNLWYLKVKINLCYLIFSIINKRYLYYVKGLKKKYKYEYIFMEFNVTRIFY